MINISADYPYINYYVINKSREEAGHFYTQNKMASHQSLNPSQSGYHVAHSMDLYDEVSRSVVMSQFQISVLIYRVFYKKVALYSIVI